MRHSHTLTKTGIARAEQGKAILDGARQSAEQMKRKARRLFILAVISTALGIAVTAVAIRYGVHHG
jgi:hypothetical protein